MYQMHKISLSGDEYGFTLIGISEYEILFDNCLSRINIGELGQNPSTIILATSRWAESGEFIKDTVTIIDEVDSPNFPREHGFKTFSIAWDSGGEVDKGFIVLKNQN